MALLSGLKYRILLASLIGLAIMATILVIKPYQNVENYDNGIVSNSSIITIEPYLKE